MPRRGAPSSGGGTRPPRPPPSREMTVSKAMSYILRHAAEREGLKLDENGYANVADLLAWQKLKSLHVTFAEVQQIVAESDKQRFALLRIPPTNSTPSSSPASPSTSPSDYLIRASQGHSLPIASANLLAPLLPTHASFPAEVVHGTFPSLWTQILASGGLKRMGRTHIHFATGEPGGSGKGKSKSKSKPANTNAGRHSDDDKEAAAELQPTASSKVDDKAAVVSGMRAAASVLVWVDVRRAFDEGGLQWWKSANGVVLTEGDAEGMVRLEFVTRVVRRGTGEVIWMPAGKLDGMGVQGEGGG